MKILIADSDPQEVKRLSECIGNVTRGSEIVSFLRGDEAWTFVKNNAPFDVAFLETELSGLDGLTLAKKLQERTPRINIVFCTSHPEYVVQALRMHASGYVDKPFTTEDVRLEFANLLYPVGKDKIFVRTFGDFDVFINNEPVTFKRQKSKELLAYLVYKHGGIANKQEISSILFGDEYDLKTQNYFVHVYSDLVKTLTGLGAGKMLIRGKNQYAVDPNTFTCDLYDMEVGKPEAERAFKGEFMSQYEWAYLELDD